MANPSSGTTNLPFPDAPPFPAAGSEPTERIGGWAPGRYLCICTVCVTRFWGDKRSIACLSCARAATNVH